MKFVAGVFVGVVIANRLKKPYNRWVDSRVDRGKEMILDYLRNNYGIVIYKEDHH